MSQVAIIIVNYNAGPWLSKSVLSALRYSNADIHVVDNCSSDNSIALAKQAIGEVHQTGVDGRLNWTENPQNVGFAAANNQVLSALDAEIAILMNPDCELRADVIDAIVATFAQDETIGVVSCLIENQDATLQKTAKRNFPTPLNTLARVPGLGKLLQGFDQFKEFDYGDRIGEQPFELVEAVSGAFMAVRMSAVKQVGLLDEGYFMHFEDLDWCKRFALNGYKLGVLNHYRVTHAKGVSSKSRPIRVLAHLHKSMVRYFQNYYREEFNPISFFLLKSAIWAVFFVRALRTLISPSKAVD